MYKGVGSPGLAGRAIDHARGRTLGGSGSINGHIYNRGQKVDFDTWAQLGNRWMVLCRRPPVLYEK